MSRPARARRARPSRRLTLAIVAVVVVVVGIAVAVVVSADAPDRYATFRRTCLAGRGNSVVVLSTRTHGSAMGAPETTYDLGCRAATGRIISTYLSNRR